MPPAAIPLIAAAGTIGGAVMAGNAQKKAAKQANASQQAATAAQLELGNKSLALQEKMFNQGLDFNKMQAGVSYDMLSPFVGSGLGATNALNALLGISPVAMGANPYNTPAPSGGSSGGSPSGGQQPPPAAPVLTPSGPTIGNSGYDLGFLQNYF